jgi:hypothetical protein
MQLAFVILQGILLLIILVQDTVNLAPFNNLDAQVRHLGWTKLVIGTLFMAIGAVVSLYLTIRFDGVPLPLSAKVFFVFWFGMTMVGMFMSWYKPYFFGPTQKELDLYQALFAGTHSILPVRHGFSGPNTLHLVLHALGIPCALFGFLKVAGVF